MCVCGGGGMVYLFFGGGVLSPRSKTKLTPKKTIPPTPPPSFKLNGWSLNSLPSAIQHIYCCSQNNLWRVYNFSLYIGHSFIGFFIKKKKRSQGWLYQRLHIIGVSGRIISKEGRLMEGFQSYLIKNKVCNHFITNRSVLTEIDWYYILLLWIHSKIGLINVYGNSMVTL